MAFLSRFRGSRSPLARDFAKTDQPELSVPNMDRHASFDVARYIAPIALTRSPSPITRVLMIGACLLDEWGAIITEAQPGVVIDRALLSHGGNISKQLLHPIESYDCAILQIPLRLVIPDHEIFSLGDDYKDGYDSRLERCISRMDQFLKAELTQLSCLPVFVMNYPLPQMNPLGRLLPRYDLRNPVFFIDALNRALNDRIMSNPDVHLLDLDQLSATFGRRFIQDDAFSISNHGGLISNYNTHADGVRLEPSEPLKRRYPNDNPGFIRAVWAEVTAMMRTLRGTDAVKLVCVDIDDTLWRGVAAEMDDPDPIIVEGWPIGFAEALAMLKRRGIILALVSKNDPERIAEIWPKVFHNRLQMSDFAIHKIGWYPKAETIAEAVAEANVLPESVVFIDDNPVERAAVAASLPGIRTLGAPHLDWRHILLWAAETQVAAISEEASRRSNMIRAQVVRETSRDAMTREAFLADLDLRVTIRTFNSVDAPMFARAFELLNKTNQFNTTGERWTHAEAVAHFESGGRWWIFNAADRFTAYGLIGVLIEHSGAIVQFVMSCRVFGLGIEHAILAVVMDDATARGVQLFAHLVHTKRNGPCRNVYADAGWQKGNGVWNAPATAFGVPAHISLIRKH